MKTVLAAGLIAMALVTGAAGCMSGTHGRMMRSQASSGEGSTSHNMMSMGQKGMMPGMMDCCTDQCPMMKGKASKAQPS